MEIPFKPIPRYKRTFFYIIFLSCLNFIICINDIELNVVLNNGIIELDSFYIINKIIGKKKKANKYSSNDLLGIFEASNDITFLDALPIGIIKEENIINDENPEELCIKINTPIPYKYIRYIPQNKLLTEINQIKIFGHQFSDTEDLSEKKIFTVTNLPLIIINTENGLEPQNKITYIKSQILIINDNKININQTASIKLRGQSTFYYPKKPYKIKFDKKQEILGLSGKYKKWVLLANYLDKALIRNLLAFKISNIIGLEFTPRCEPVDLIMNGNFRGNYLICDQIEVNKGRVDIEEITEDDETGGYLLEIDGRAASEEKYFKTNKGILIEIKYPDSDDITQAQEQYIKQFMDILEKNVYNGNLTYIDLDSFYKYFLMQEFCADIDGVWSSFHLTKRKGDEKLYFGPVWDYDRTFDNDIHLIPTNEKLKFILYYGGSSGTTRQFIITILEIKNIMSNINKTWTILQENGLDSETLKVFIEEKKNFLYESANLNNLRWYGSKIGNGKKDYSDYIDVVVNYIEKRFDTLSKIINNYSKDLIFYKECIVTWTTSCQKFLCEEILRKDQTKACSEYFLSDANRGKGTHICIENKDKNSEKACSEVSKYPIFNNENPGAIIFILISYILLILLSN